MTRCEYIQAWRRANPDKVKLYNKRCRDKIRRECFLAYGGIFCACCGIDEIAFLALDHINGGGSQEKRELGRLGDHLYRTLKRRGYPPGYQVLCANCNTAKSFQGICPHQRNRSLLKDEKSDAIN